MCDQRFSRRVRSLERAAVWPRARNVVAFEEYRTRTRARSDRVIPPQRYSGGGCRRGRGRISRRFHPKRCASTDHMPGPTSASAAPRDPITMQPQRYSGYANALHSAVRARSVPPAGVHKPMTSSQPRTMQSICNETAPSGGPLRNPLTAAAIAAPPATRRISKSPIPGGPRAKVE